MHPKRLRKNKWVFKKQRVEVWLPWSNIILTKGCRLIVCQVKNAKFNWTRTAMSLKFPTFSRRFRTLLSVGGPICILYGLVGSLGHARLTAIKSAFWTWHTISLHPLVKIMLDHGSQTSTPCFLNPIYFFFNFFWIHM